MNRIPRAPRWHQLDILGHYHEHNAKEFRRIVRVSPQVFDTLHAMLEPHPVFHNNSHRAQTPVNIQLAIFLKWAGHYGNGVSIADIAEWAGVSTGTVTNCTRRVVVAVLDHHDEAVCWPNVEQQISAKRFSAERTGCAVWSGGFLAVDGTAIKLYQKPGLYGERFYNKDSIYAISLQVVILVDSLLIVDYSVGHVGSVHDTVAYRETFVHNNHDTHLTPAEWVLADSAYPLYHWCMTPFKRPPHG
ncbi:hypothetical protein OBBRIDRAFT_741246, partial [Obba rivulosa]